MANPDVLLRPAVEGDAGLIVSSWLKSYRAAKPPELEDVRPAVYYADSGHHGVVLRALDRAGAVVAASPEHPDVIYGWACYEGAVLHYLYVKDLWRRKHVGQRLLALVADPLVVTHLTPAFRKLAGKREHDHDPYRRP